MHAFDPNRRARRRGSEPGARSCHRHRRAAGDEAVRAQGAFIPSAIGATEAFYCAVLQPVRGWVPPAPKLTSGGVGDGESVGIEGDVDEQVRIAG